MKRRIHFLVLSLGLSLGFLLQGCEDESTCTFTYVGYEPVYMSFEELRSAVRSETPQTVQIPGKIYVYKDYLLVGEVGEGIHIIDNSNPSAPIPLNFINIPGNVDMAIRNDVLYADSYIDLVAIDLTDPMNPREIHRVEDAFPYANVVLPQRLPAANPAVSFFVDPIMASGFDPSKGILIDMKETEITREMPEGCETGNPQYLWTDDMVFMLESASAFRNNVNMAPSQGNTGVGGSMARFTIAADFLYTVDDYALQLFSIQTPQTPQKSQRIEIGWGIETIFPYQDKLFIGSQTGMHIFDNSNPEKPSLMSSYEHIQSCDPVVVQGDLAYVTLRSGNLCRDGVNRLDVVSIANPYAPKQVAEYRMQNPHGLGIDGANLFICEGEYGLKKFDATDPLAIANNLTLHVEGIHAYDVIPYNNVLIMTGNDGIHQYDYSNPEQIKLLSTIPVVRSVE